MRTSFHRLVPPGDDDQAWRLDAFATHVQRLALAAAGAADVPVEHVSVVVDDADTLVVVIFQREDAADHDGLLERLLPAMQAQSSALDGWQVGR